MTFLETFKRTRSYQNWFPDRFDNESIGNLGRIYRPDDIKIWEETEAASETSTRRVVAVANPDTPPARACRTYHRARKCYPA